MLLPAEPSLQQGHVFAPFLICTVYSLAECAKMCFEPGKDFQNNSKWLVFY